MLQRIDKILAHALSISRADVTRLIRNKRIKINGAFIKSSATKIAPTDAIEFDDVLLTISSAKRYFMLNKPKGYVCANNDPSYPCVTALLDEPSAYSFHSAGRLDVDTTGLVLLTDDGVWSHNITSPKNKCSKIYHVTVKHPLKAEYITEFSKGILLKQEKYPTQPAKLSLLNDYEALLEIYEGKYHQVKRMFAAVQNRVVDLKRIQIGDIALDKCLLEGEYRALTQEEIDLFTKR